MTEDCYYYIDAEFEELYEKEWFEDPLVQEIMGDIDECDYTGVGCRDKIIPPMTHFIFVVFIVLVHSILQKTISLKFFCWKLIR